MNSNYCPICYTYDYCNCLVSTKAIPQIKGAPDDSFNLLGQGKLSTCGYCSFKVYGSELAEHFKTCMALNSKPSYYSKIANVQIVDHPDYYKSTKFEVIDIIEEFNLGFNAGNVLKYVLRAGKKTEDKLRDMEKALWYLTREVENLKKDKK